MEQHNSNEAELLNILLSSPLIRQIFELLKEEPLCEYYIGAGCIAQTVWNHRFGKAFDYGIKDIDFVYYDERDLSLEAEEQVIQNIRTLLEPTGKEIDCKNQARVHLWYESKFGLKLEQYTSLEAAIATWPTTASAIGIRPVEGSYKICAPYGLDDLLAGVIRPNKKLITKEIYDNKSNQWKLKWDELEIVSW